MSEEETYDEQPSYVGAVFNAYHVIRMHNIIEKQKLEIADLKEIRDQYIELTKNSQAHATKMHSNMMTTLLTPGVADALMGNGNPEDFKT